MEKTYVLAFVFKNLVDLIRAITSFADDRNDPGWRHEHVSDACVRFWRSFYQRCVRNNFKRVIAFLRLFDGLITTMRSPPLLTFFNKVQLLSVFFCPTARIAMPDKSFESRYFEKTLVVYAGRCVFLAIAGSGGVFIESMYEF